MQREIINTDLERWFAGEGEEFLRDIGLKDGQTVLDFGCGSGHYTIPAAKVVADEGKVYALEEDTETLSRLAQTAKSGGLENIIPITTLSDLKINLKNELLDAVLFYDVLHYMNAKQRQETYEEVRKILRNDGLLSVYPKHYKADEPLDNFTDMKLDDIIEEIANASFTLRRKFFKELIHDDNYDKGIILILVR